LLRRVNKLEAEKEYTLHVGACKWCGESSRHCKEGLALRRKAGIGRKA